MTDKETQEKIKIALLDIRWAEPAKDGVVEVKASEVYPMALKRLGVEKIDQYWLEVARRCFTTHLRDLLRLHGVHFLHLRIVSDVDDFKIKKHAPGGGPEAGAQEFRKHFQRYLQG